MIAQDAQYHRNCLTSLYKKASTAKLEGHYTDKERQLHGIAFSEIISYIEEAYNSSETAIPLFKLSDLIKMYTESLKALGLELKERIHSTRFKQRILFQFDDLKEYREGKQIILAFVQNVGDALKSAASIDYDDEGYILAEAARIIRRDMINFEQQEFHGHYEDKCQEKSTPKSLQALMSLIVSGKGGGSGDGNPYFKQAVLSMSQLLYFNLTKRTRQDSKSAYHTKEREPPIVRYIGQFIHSHTRQDHIVEKLSHLGKK